MTDNRTNELREKLDALGIKHTDASYKQHIPITVWTVDGATFCYVDGLESTDLHIDNATPEQAIAATLGRPKAKSHPYGYECDTGAYDCTRCECGCINDISATYCNDCGGEIEIDEYAEKEFYEYNRNSVFVVKHDDGTLEFGGKRYVPEDAATLGSEREKELEELVRDWRACDPKCTNRSCGDCEHDEDDGCGLYRRMHELGVIA